MYKVLKQSFAVNYEYDVHFTKGMFDTDNPILSEVVEKQMGGPAKVLVVMDSSINQFNPDLLKKITNYMHAHSKTMVLCGEPLCLSGSEGIKNDPHFINMIYKCINEGGICRHSYVMAIGGGALLDAVGFAAATAHRGVRLIRVPTTVLSQDDSGVGVKNGINFFGKKNYIGTFAPPYAVINDIDFVKSLADRDWLSGLAEAVKVSLIKDAEFFHYIYNNADALRETKDLDILQNIICQSANFHLKHIGTQGDPFEMGSSRPLDFGHWAAHKLEQTTNHRLRHGEAVAIGVALDSTYSYLTGLMSERDWRLIIDVFKKLNLALFVPELTDNMADPYAEDSIFKGLIEFREHLGGQLTIMMLKKIGQGMEVHEVDFDKYRQAIGLLQEIAESQVVDRIN
ncbi:MAG: 3-dehydroquinate synthase [Tatlockia sp.]|jgi:3-dehydroquinate synthase